MKRIIAAVALTTLASVLAVAQTIESDRPDVDSLPFGDARAYGLAGAMTAVNDDMNTLFFNPAGLSFLRRKYLTIESGLGTSTYMSAETQSMGGSSSGSSYSETNQGATTEDPVAYYTPLIVQPKFVLGGKGWGVALTADYLSYAANDYEEVLTDLPMYTSRRIGAVAGLGFNLGPLALGANMKYYGYSAYDFTVSKDDEDVADLATQMLVGPGFEFSDWEMGVGLGAIVTLGSLNVGAYYDNMMPFIKALASGEDYSMSAYVRDCFETMSLGLSYMPSDNKFGKSKMPLALLASADLKNLGSNSDRELCAGVEAGLDLWNFLVATARVGYKQALPTETFSFDALVEAFAPDNGEFYVGATAKFAAAKLDLTIISPLGAIESTYDSEPMDWTELKVRATLALCL